MNLTAPVVPAEDLRRAMRTVPTGVAVVTSHGPAGGCGMTATSFTSVSLRPPLMCVCVRQDSPTLRQIGANGVFAINVLAAGQEALLAHFASATRPRSAEVFDGFEHGFAATGSPIFDRVGAYLDCRVTSTHRAGDHEILLGEVVAVGTDTATRPLVVHGGQVAALPG